MERTFLSPGGHEWVGMFLRWVEAPALLRVSSLTWLTWHFSLDNFSAQPMFSSLWRCLKCYI